MTKNNKPISEKKERPSGPKGKLQVMIVSAIIVAVSVGAGLMLSGGSVDDAPHALGGEKRPTMSPAYFVGKTAKSYKIAREIPEILDNIYCYCRCQDNFGHKSLLTCFVDRHGSQCGVCMDEALMAAELHKKGYDKEEIRKEIDAHFLPKSKRI